MQTNVHATAYAMRSFRKLKRHRAIMRQRARYLACLHDDTIVPYYLRHTDTHNERMRAMRDRTIERDQLADMRGMP